MHELAEENKAKFKNSRHSDTYILINCLGVLVHPHIPHVQRESLSPYRVVIASPQQSPSAIFSLSFRSKVGSYWFKLPPFPPSQNLLMLLHLILLPIISHLTLRIGLPSLLQLAVSQFFYYHTHSSLQLIKDETYQAIIREEIKENST